MKQLLSIFTAIPLLLFVINISAQDLNKNLDDFSRLSVASSITMELIPSITNKMEVEITNGKLVDLKIEEKGDNLRIYIDGDKNYGPDRTQAAIKLYYTNLDELSVAAGARVYSDAVIENSDFEADVSSGASLSLELDIEDLDSNVSSGGTFSIGGTAGSVDINASSGGSFRGSNLKSEHAQADASSGGSISIWASKSIEAETTSGGSIKYGGNPAQKEIDRNKWSGGSIKAI